MTIKIVDEPENCPDNLIIETNVPEREILERIQINYEKKVNSK